MGTPISKSDQYTYLSLGTLPKMFQEALRHNGIMEIKGPGNNAEIMKWARELGIQRIYTADAIPWCGILPAIAAHRTGWPVVKDPLWALNWRSWQRQIDFRNGEKAGLGDIVTLVRAGGGHVGFYAGWSRDKKYVRLFGANQTDAVNFAWMEAARIQTINRAIWRIAQPSGVRELFLDKKTNDIISINEA